MVEAPGKSVTIIVLLYNDVAYGDRAIRSALQQSYRDIRVKVLDNGSSDGTRELISKYRHDSRVEIIASSKNLKSELATKVAVDCDTDFISFLFSDDFLDPKKIELQLLEFEKNEELAAVFSESNFIDQNGDKIETHQLPDSQFSGRISLLSQAEHLRHFFFTGNSLHPCGMLIRTDVYKKLGGFKSYLHRIGDLEFFTRLLACYKVSFIEDSLQSITIFKNGRNLSASNNNFSLALHYERAVLLEAFLEPQVLDRLVEIFNSPADIDIRLENQADKLWFLGHQALRKKGDMAYFGMRCLYKAASIDESGLNRKILASTGLSLGEYFESLTFEQVSSIKRLKRFIKHRILSRAMVDLATRLISRLKSGNAI